MKKCNKCGEVKPLTDFYKDKRKNDGLSVRCIGCDQKAGKDRREKYRKINKSKPFQLFALSKKCIVCGEIKSENDFAKDITKKDGLFWECKDCFNEYRRKKYETKKALGLTDYIKKPPRPKPTEEELEHRRLLRNKKQSEYNIKKWKSTKYNQCKEAASNCNNRRDYYKISTILYNAARINGWLDEFFPLYKNNMSRYLYSFVFSDNCAYVGLTASPDKRYKDHITSKKSAVYLHIEQTGLTPEWNIYPDGPHDQDKAAKLEQKLIDKFNKKGYKLLNRVKGGGLGGYYSNTSVEDAIRIAKKCKSRAECLTKYRNAYMRLKKENLLNKLLPVKQEYIDQKPPGYWTYERCKEECIKNITRSRMKKNNWTVLQVIKKNGWADELLPLTY